MFVISWYRDMSIIMSCLLVTMLIKSTSRRHVDDIINSRASSMYAISVLRSHGMCVAYTTSAAGQSSSQSSPTLRGFSAATYRQRIRHSFVELLDLWRLRVRRLPKN